MKKIITIILAIAGFVLTLSAPYLDEIRGATIPLSQLVMLIFAGFMLMGMSFALVRWK